MALDLKQATQEAAEKTTGSPAGAAPRQGAGLPGVRAVRAKRARRTLLQRIWKERTAYLLILPAILGFLLFFAYPAGFAFVASFTKYDNFTMQWTSDPLFNYGRIFRDRTVARAYLNVLEYAVLTLGLGQTFSLGLALALNSLRNGAGFFRTIYYIPVVTSVVAIAILFRWLFANDEYGIMNQVVYALTGLGPIGWMGKDADTLFIPVLSFISIWAGFGFSTIIWMAGLKAIPPEYYEVARIDGAPSLRQLWSITLPLLRPIVLFQLVLGFIGAMKEFGMVLVLTQICVGGVGCAVDAAQTPVLLIYRSGFVNFQMGYGSAMAFVLTFILIVVAIVQMRIFGKQETYE